MEGNEFFIEGFKALAQIGMSSVFIIAWWNERKINERVVSDYFKLREMTLQIEKERVKLEFAQLIGKDNVHRLTKTDIKE